MFAKVIANRVNKQLPKISPYQFGFRSHRSTGQAILAIRCLLQRRIEKDLSKRVQKCCEDSGPPKRAEVLHAWRKMNTGKIPGESQITSDLLKLPVKMF